VFLSWLLDGGVGYRTLCFRCHLAAGLTLLQLQETRWVVISVKDFVWPVDWGSVWVGFHVTCWCKLLTTAGHLIDKRRWGEIGDTELKWLQFSFWLLSSINDFILWCFDAIGWATWCFFVSAIDVPFVNRNYLRRRLGIVSLGVCLSRYVCVHRFSLGGEGNALYPVLCSFSSVLSDKVTTVSLKNGPLCLRL